MLCPSPPRPHPTELTRGSLIDSIQKKKLPRVAIYTTRNCPNCSQVKAAMREWGVPFQELDIEKNRRAAKEFSRLRARAVPLIRIGERVLQVNHAKHLKALLSDAGFQLRGY